MAWKDYEPDFMYLVCAPETYASFRSANMVDDVGVVEQNVTFSTLFGGKIRLIQTRAAQGLSGAQFTKLNTGVGIDLVGQKTSFLVLPGALAMEPLNVPTPVEIFRDARAFAGGGSTDIWYRWGYVVHPAGYDWAGSTTVFPDDAAYMNAVEGATPLALTSVVSGTLASTTGTWIRKTASALSLGILPVFHS